MKRMLYLEQQQQQRWWWMFASVRFFQESVTVVVSFRHSKALARGALKPSEADSHWREPYKMPFHPPHGMPRQNQNVQLLALLCPLQKWCVCISTTWSRPWNFFRPFKMRRARRIQEKLAWINNYVEKKKIITNQSDWPLDPNIGVTSPLEQKIVAYAISDIKQKLKDSKQDMGNTNRNETFGNKCSLPIAMILCIGLWYGTC